MTGELEKAILVNTVSGEEIPVLFNPSDYAIDRSNAFATLVVPGRGAPVLQFIAGAQSTLKMELYVDTTERIPADPTKEAIVAAHSDVRVQTDRITGLMRIAGESHAPPILIFTWGSLTFECVLAKAETKFTHFLASGIPIRARITCTFGEIGNAETEAREVKRETADYTKRHIVTEGDSLPALAFREYGAPGLWRVIAIENDIHRPRRLEIGAELRLPRLPYRDRLTGRLYG